jgi:chloride channel protein, CIC family
VKRNHLGGALLSNLRLPLGDRSTMILLAALIGIAGGFGAVFFRWLIETFQDLAWGEGGSPFEKIARSSWQMRLLVPSAGGLLVGLIVKFLAPEAKGHGVPEVMNAVARLGGVIRPIVAIAKSLASAICIATGGSVGREGPIVQIGAAMGSSLGQVLHLSPRRIRTCVGCGAAAGIAATFNAPIAAAFFAAEVILGEFGVGAFGSVVISSVSATVVARTIMGDIPAFEIPAYAIVHPAEMFTYVVLGLLSAIVGVAFVQTLHASEDGFEKLTRIPEYLKPVLGGIGIGLIGLLMPEVMGVGYDTITAALHGQVGLMLLLVILVVKVISTSFTLGSGGSGGVFAPSLFMGAALGGAVGHAAQAIMPFPMASPGAYAVVGMGAMVAAATHAPITAILIIFELTGDYGVIPGLMTSCIIGTFLAQKIRRESIYTIKLMRRGIDLQAGQEMNVLRSVPVRDIMRSDIDTVGQNATLDQLYSLMVNSPHYEFFVVNEAGELVGVVSVDDLRKALPLMERVAGVTIAHDVMTGPVVYLREDETLDFAMRQFEKRTFEELPVLPAGDGMEPIGYIQRQDVIKAYNKEILKVDLAGSLSSRIQSTEKYRMWETVGGYVLAHMDSPPHLVGKSLASLQLRQKAGIQLILIDRQDETGDKRFTFPGHDTELKHGDRIIVFGRRADVDAWQ